MKKLLFAIVFLFCVIGLKAQNNTPNLHTQIGQFAWKRTAQDSVDIMRLPFMRETLYFIPEKGRGDVTGTAYIVYPDNRNSSQENKKK